MDRVEDAAVNWRSSEPSEEEAAAEAKNDGSTQRSKRRKVEERGCNASNRVKEEHRALLRTLRTHQHGWLFNAPVDPVELGLPDYFEIIAKPMDLRTISTKLNNGQYRTCHEFYADVVLTFDNATLQRGGKRRPLNGERAQNPLPHRKGPDRGNPPAEDLLWCRVAGAVVSSGEESSLGAFVRARRSWVPVQQGTIRDHQGAAIQIIK